MTEVLDKETARLFVCCKTLNECKTKFIEKYGEEKWKQFLITCIVQECNAVMYEDKITVI